MRRCGCDSGFECGGGCGNNGDWVRLEARVAPDKTGENKLYFTLYPKCGEPLTSNGVDYPPEAGDGAKLIANAIAALGGGASLDTIAKAIGNSGGGGGGGMSRVITRSTESGFLQGSGTESNPLGAHVRLSNRADNAISIDPLEPDGTGGGIYVPPATAGTVDSEARAAAKAADDKAAAAQKAADKAQQTADAAKDTASDAFNRADAARQTADAASSTALKAANAVNGKLDNDLSRGDGSDFEAPDGYVPTIEAGKLKLKAPQGGGTSGVDQTARDAAAAAQTTANKASTDAANALGTANQAQTTANQAQSKANDAADQADRAVSLSQAANETADSAETKAQYASEAADDAKTAAANCLPYDAANGVWDASRAQSAGSGSQKVAKQIRNVADGTADTDAATVAQLKAAEVDTSRFLARGTGTNAPYNADAYRISNIGNATDNSDAVTLWQLNQAIAAVPKGGAPKVHNITLTVPRTQTSQSGNGRTHFVTLIDSTNLQTSCAETPQIGDLINFKLKVPAGTYSLNGYGLGSDMPYPSFTVNFPNQTFDTRNSGNNFAQQFASLVNAGSTFRVCDDNFALEVVKGTEQYDCCGNNGVATDQVSYLVQAGGAFWGYDQVYAVAWPNAYSPAYFQICLHYPAEGAGVSNGDAWRYPGGYYWSGLNPTYTDKDGDGKTLLPRGLPYSQLFIQLCDAGDVKDNQTLLDIFKQLKLTAEIRFFDKNKKSVQFESISTGNRFVPLYWNGDEANDPYPYIKLSRNNWLFNA